MFEIIKKNNSRFSHALYLNGRLFSERLFIAEEDGRFYIDGFPKFDIKEIAGMKADEFPDGFEFQFQSPVDYENCFDMFTIRRKDNVITISLWGNMDLDSTEEWLIWHPVRFIEKANDVAMAKGYKLSPRQIEDDVLLFFMDFAVKSTIGELFNQALSQLHEVLTETDKQMWKQATSHN